MSDDDGYGQFYAEVHTPASVRATYAPPGSCLGCDAKLSIYRTQSYGEYQKWCSACEIKGEFLLPCDSCWEMFPSFGTRTICSKCLVPSQRKIREVEAMEKAQEAWILLNQNVSFDRIADTLQYSNALEARRALERYMEITTEGIELWLENLEKS